VLSSEVFAAQQTFHKCSLLKVGERTDNQLAFLTKVHASGEIGLLWYAPSSAKTPLS